MADQNKSTPSENTNISIDGDVNGVVVVGNENTVNQTIIQKFFNIFKSDSETLEQRNRRILIGDFLGAVDSTTLEHGVALRSDGSTLRELHALLKAKDPGFGGLVRVMNKAKDPGFGGLVRVMNKRQEFLWVHEKFAGKY